MPYNAKVFGNVVGRLRCEKGLSQAQLSIAVGTSRSHLAMIESGRRVMRVDTLWKIAEALDIRPSEMIQRVEDES